MAVSGTNGALDESSSLRAEFTIEPHPAANCSILESGPRSDDVTRNLVPTDETRETDVECRSAVTDPETGGQQYLVNDVSGRCICPIFHAHECTTSIERYEAGAMDIVVMTPSNDVLTSLVEELRETGATVQLRRISHAGGGNAESSLEIDVDGVTDKQREAVCVAVEAGYFETPREANLDELADRLGVSPSAVSQRLSAVQSKLVTSLFEQQSL
ncbi:helix-turn-helix domain-containing protein [Natronorubrum daqingense]|uniref:Uncharacterized protein n=1 Tax=Natronorubrum daqingense TaxID=588898 RepID=A0A1N7DVX5_9EURY|nr:helix-turn-helix domain-containing protein [Natronorubrum daqingense]APX96207.1 hypothetical protein BB347_05975 [Natronorubrum daqingense]SIR79948.1 hypothetical protein SAMN05421809_2277 [Natronorubrum daqingense]